MTNDQERSLNIVSLYYTVRLVSGAFKKASIFPAVSIISLIFWLCVPVFNVEGISEMSI